jgi:hypothetical protein
LRVKILSPPNRSVRGSFPYPSDHSIGFLAMV